jgi:hypothetical protein
MKTLCTSGFAFAFLLIAVSTVAQTSASGSGLVRVRFVGFEAVKKTAALQLTWRVHEEDKLKSYEIQRGSDGAGFESIGTIAATNAGEYSFTDSRPLSGKSYYRIKSNDIDKRFGYSSVLSVSAGKSAIVFKAFPSVVQEQFTVQHDAATAATRIVVNSEDGRLVENIIPSPGCQQTLVDLSSAKPGLYLVRLENGTSAVETLKVVKQ